MDKHSTKTLSDTKSGRSHVVSAKASTKMTVRPQASNSQGRRAHANLSSWKAGSERAMCSTYLNILIFYQHPKPTNKGAQASFTVVAAMLWSSDPHDRTSLAGPRLLQAFFGGGEGPNVVHGRQLKYCTCSQFRQLWSQLLRHPRDPKGSDCCELGSGNTFATSLSTPKATAHRLAL